jgi:hypothetical protein
MALEGRIDIALVRQGAGATQARIVSSRPQVAQRLMAGRTPAEAAELAGMIFTLCGKAQRLAAEIACAAALGEEDRVEAAQARPLKILAEMAQEHAWRMLLDWPTRQGRPADPGLLLSLRRAAAEPPALAEALDAVLAGPLLGEPATAWLTRFAGADALAGFDAWAHAQASPTAALFSALCRPQDIGISVAPLLPGIGRLTDDGIEWLAAQALQSPAFCARPVWPVADAEPRPAETGALARSQSRAPLRDWLAQRGRGVGARMLARLLELANLPAGLRGDAPTLLRAWSLPDQVGVAAVETSRGLLLHLVRLAGGRVDQYRIIAPTEWNFHPEGPLAEALSGCSAETDLHAAAQQIAVSLDPCVDYGITLEKA